MIPSCNQKAIYGSRRLYGLLPAQARRLCHQVIAKWYQKVNYLHHNPVRIGVVERPEDWVYSSAGDYAGGRGLIELDALA